MRILQISSKVLEHLIMNEIMMDVCTDDSSAPLLMTLHP
jgi:hypothetical protein